MYLVPLHVGAGELALKPGEINAMIAAVDENQDGKVTYGGEAVQLASSRPIA
jgi:hypothetical protein